MCINDSGSVMILYIISLSVNTEGKLECKCGVFVKQFRGFLYCTVFLEITIENNVKQTGQRARMLTFHFGIHLLAISDTPEVSFTPYSSLTGWR